MRGRGEQRQIRGIVVGLIAVDVMDVLVACKASAQMLLHHVAVLKDVALLGIGMFRHAEQGVASSIDVSTFATFHAATVVASKETEMPEAAGSLIRSLAASAFAKACRGGQSLQRHSPFTSCEQHAMRGCREMVLRDKPSLRILWVGGFATSALAVHTISIAGQGG